MTKEQEDKIIQDATEYVKGMNQGMERMRARQGYIAGATSRTTESQPSSDQIAGMRKDMDMALEREKELIAALDQSVILIRRWHDMYDQKSDKDSLNEIWRIYYEKSPEMKLIRKALAPYNQSPSTGEQEEWNRNERYETRLALHKMIKVLDTKDLAQTESNLRLVAQDILKKYSKPEDVLR